MQLQVALVNRVVEGIQSIEAEEMRLFRENLAILQRTTRCLPISPIPIAHVAMSVSCGCSRALALRVWDDLQILILNI